VIRWCFRGFGFCERAERKQWWLLFREIAFSVVAATSATSSRRISIAAAPPTHPRVSITKEGPALDTIPAPHPHPHHPLLPAPTHHNLPRSFCSIPYPPHHTTPHRPSSMQLLSSIVFRWREGVQPIFLAQFFHLAQFSFWQRGSAKEVCIFVTREVVSRAKAGDRVSVGHQGHVCHLLIYPNGLGAAVVTDEEYPVRVAFSFILKTLADYQAAVPADAWAAVQADTTRSLPEVEALIVKYQDPHEADALMRTQRELEDVRETMIKNIDTLLARGEKYVVIVIVVVVACLPATYSPGVVVAVVQARVVDGALGGPQLPVQDLPARDQPGLLYHSVRRRRAALPCPAPARISFVSIDRAPRTALSFVFSPRLSPSRDSSPSPLCSCRI